MEKAKRREVDLLLNMFKSSKEREAYLNFTKSYKQTLNAIIVRTETTDVHTLTDLAEQTIAVVTGDSAVKVLQELYPGIRLVETENYEEALKVVAFGRAEATLMELPVAGYLIRKLAITNLMVAAEGDNPDDRDLSYRLAVRKDWPELIPILEKAMDSLTREELTALDKRWLALQEIAPIEEIGLFRWTQLLPVSLVLVLLVAVILLLFRLLDRSRKDPLAYQFASPAGRRVAVLFTSMLIMFIALLAWWALGSIKTRIKEDVRDSLQMVLQTTREALNIWAKNQKNELELIASDPHVVGLVTGLLARYHQDDDLLSSRELKSLRQLFLDFQTRSDHIGFFVIAPDGISVGSLRDANVGTLNLIQQQRPDLLRRAFAGETVLVPSIISDVPLNGAANISGSDLPPTMFFAAPVRNEGGDVIAVLTERFNPHEDFSAISLLARIGKSGEAYTFDRQGWMLTESRFVPELISAGLIQPKEQGILSIDVRNPGGNLMDGYRSPVPRSAQPLTRMAASALKGESGFDVDGYLDYRGVPVIGAWSWDESLGIGFASEINLDEAMASYYSVRLAIMVTLGVTALVSIILTVIIMLLGSRANRVLQASRDQLEIQVQERTRELALANKDLEGFSYSVSHDLRAPLRHISGYINLLGRQPALKEEGKHLHYMEMILDSSQQMGQLIDDLLVFSRMGRAELQNESVNLNELIDDIMRSQKKEIEGRTINWAVAQLPPVSGDRNMLRVVMVNLISNAIKYSQREATAEIEIGSCPGEDNRNVIFIRDNGVGFNMAYAHKLYGVFQRLHSDEEFEGTGIGLATVERIIHRHHGTVWAESIEGQGATFYFSI